MYRLAILPILFSYIFVNAVFAYTDEDIFPRYHVDEDTSDVEETEPVYDERFDPELWGVSLVKLWDMYETIPFGKVLEASFEATRGMDYVIIVRGKGIESFLRTPYDTSLYTPLKDPLIEAKILEAIGNDEATYNYLGNAKENGEYVVRVESRSGGRKQVQIDVFVVNKWRRIRLEEEEETPDNENPIEMGSGIPEGIVPDGTELTIDEVEE